VGQASEDVDAKYEGGPDLTIAFTPAILMDGVEAIIGTEVILETIDSTKPATVRSTENDKLIAISPHAGQSLLAWRSHLDGEPAGRPPLEASCEHADQSSLAHRLS